MEEHVPVLKLIPTHDGPDSAAESKTATAPEMIGFEGFGKSFGEGASRVVAASGVDLSIAQGEFVTVVGPSGCGKSTLLNAAAGVFKPSEGTVRYRGAPVVGYNQRVGYMTQSDHLLPWRKVAANIAVPLEIRGLPKAMIKEKVDALLELVGLTGFGASYPSQLSGGMRKRCALARLLAYDPETLLLDEPFGALDAQLRLEMQGELRDLCIRLGKTVLFVTHDLDEAIALGDRCVVFSPRPGSVREIIDAGLPRERDLYGLRLDPRYVAGTARLWTLLAPASRPRRAS